MNVLHVHSGNMFGGVERMLQALAPRVAGTSPVASSYALCFEGRTAETLRAEGGTVHHLGAVRVRRPGEIRRARQALRAVLDAHRPDVAAVHSAWSQAIFGPTIRAAGVPLVRWMHAPEPGPLWTETWAARSMPHLVLCNSRHTLDGVRGRLSGVPLAVCYPPARATVPDPDARADVRRNIGTASDTVVIVIAARMEAWKGHETLLASAGNLEPGSWEIWVAGGPQRDAEVRYFERLSKMARTIGRQEAIRFLGERTDIHRVLQAADIYCQPNTGPEPFGLSFVEALSAGLPVVTTNIGAASEIVDERCGVLVEPRDVPALAAALRRLIGDGRLREQMGAAARERAREFCDLRRCLADLERELGRVARTGRAVA
jgi:glycosyltransferase involved in cell wall biosynthesis